MLEVSVLARVQYAPKRKDGSTYFYRRVQYNRGRKKGQTGASMGSNARPVQVDRIVLHIGTEKTGTSSVQHFLSKNRVALAAEGVVYPRFTGPNGGSQWGVVAAVLEQPWKMDIGTRLGIRDEIGAETYRQQ